MGLEKLNTDLGFIQKLSTYPNEEDGLSAEELKAKFDEGPIEIQNYINETLIPQLDATYDMLMIDLESCAVQDHNLKELISQNKTNIDSLQLQQETHADSIDKLTDRMSSAEDRLSEEETALEGYEGRIKELEEDQLSTDNELTRHDERLMSIETEYVRTVNGRYPFEGNVVIGDDSTIGNDFWSSKNIIDRLCPAFTESGSIVTCTPVEGYPLEVVSVLPESEDGISAVTLWRGGANLFPPIDSLDGLEVNGITFRVEGGKIIMNGTATAAVNTGVKTKVWLPAGTYTVSGNPYPGNDVRLWLRIYGTTTQRSSYNGNSATVTLEEAAYVYLYITINSDAAVVLDDFVISPMVNVGSTALPWEPYRGESFAADFGNTVYGGSYDWISGVLTDENGNVTQLTAQQIPALSGTNTLYSDTGDTAVTGRADPSALFEKLTNAIIALGSNV